MPAAMPTADPLAAAHPTRDASIDVLRGFVMVLMALDHTRDFVMGFAANPTDLDTTTYPLFFTRWVTHFCAPVFVLLAGTAAWLSRKKRSRTELSRFLVSRGLWLVLLEVTIVRAGWMLNLNYHFVVLQVIWAIGWSMVLLALLIHLPTLAVGAIGLAMIFGHNLLDGVTASSFGGGAWAWELVHQPAMLHPIPWTTVRVVYPLIPWSGVMAVGYALGALLDVPTSERKRRLYTLGLALIAAFIVVRGLRIYGDPHPWSSQPRGFGFTLLSFLNCEKYPPSLCYLLMTLGPSLCILAWLTARTPGPLARVFETFGRVPLFYYLLHLFIIHAVVILLVLPRLLTDAAFRTQLLSTGAPAYHLPTVYLAWLLSLLLLLPLCRRFSALKRRSPHPLLSYL